VDQFDDGKCRNNRNKGDGASPVYEYSTGGYGTYNQSENVWEWCPDCYGLDYYDHNAFVIEYCSKIGLGEPV
jgi:formylglycine-generating enzyme required for sulfatase activity